MIKTGDTVRFLDLVGGGTVTGFKGKDIVLVEDEDGFAVPTLLSQCVLVEPAKDSKVADASEEPEESAPLETPKPRLEPYLIQETPEGDVATVALAFLYENIKRIGVAPVEAYLINDSNYYLSYNYACLTDKGWRSAARGEIEPNTKIFLEEIAVVDFDRRQRLSLQFIAFKKDREYSLTKPCSAQFAVDTRRFLKLHHFTENDYTDEPALLFYALRNGEPPRQITVDPIQLKAAKTPQPTKKEAKPHQNLKQPIETDLHIYELTDNVGGMSNHEMLEMQLSRFRQLMAENQARKGQRIVFIHGKGKGVLRSAIEKELKSKYPKASFQDASFREYGFGAIQVTIR
jgi:hypothetical protein